jgi:hypothetical protein
VVDALYLRIEALKAQQGDSSDKSKQHEADWLSPIPLRGQQCGGGSAVSSRRRASNDGCLNMQLEEYLQLLDWAGRQRTRADKHTMAAELPPILERLGLTAAGWKELTHDFRRLFRSAAGTPASLDREAERRGSRGLHGISASRRIFGHSGGHSGESRTYRAARATAIVRPCD